MKRNTEILNEIESISPMLASLQDINVFKVPDGYFNGLPDDVKERVAHIDLTEFGAKQVPVQRVPVGYFENLSTSILQKIKVSEEVEQDTQEVLFALPPALRKVNVFEVPNGYFESLPSQILSKVRPRAVIVPLYKRPIFRHAIAAAIAVVLFVGAFFTISNQRDHDQNGFSVVSKATVPYQDAVKYNSQKAFDAGIAALTDEQIIAYLQSHGTILDNDLLLENADTSGLPELQDYLLNDDALDEYLEKISMSNGI